MAACKTSGALPSIQRQKCFIVENSGHLNRGTQLSILAVVMMEVGPSAETAAGRKVVVAESGRTGVDIDLNVIEAANPEVITHIYNITHARIAALNRPAAGDGQSSSRRLV